LFLLLRLLLCGYCIVLPSIYLRESVLSICQIRSLVNGTWIPLKSVIIEEVTKSMHCIHSHISSDKV
jgi:hypothetical protein